MTEELRPPETALRGLPPPARYFAPRRGRYEVTPGMTKLGADFGNGPMDARLFQIDRDYPRYRQNKLACRAERLDKYAVYSPEFEGATAEAAWFIADRLAAEYPGLFTREARPGGACALDCALTGERLVFDRQMRLLAVEGSTPTPPYRDAFDALCCQTPEDVVVVALPPGGSDRNAALYVCAPSRWRPEEKRGASFVGTHAPVPHFERVARAADQLLSGLLVREPVTRFNWGIEFTDRLNLHPDPPLGADPLAQDRRDWNPADPRPIFLRLERQGLWGLPDAALVLFTIRIYLRPVETLTIEERRLLASGLRSLSEATLAYRGMSEATRNALAKRLEAG